MQTIYTTNFAGKFVKALLLAVVVAFASFSNANAQSTANYTVTTNTISSLALLSDGTTAVDMSTGTTACLTTQAGQDQSISASAISLG
ncbi:MAG: hypothetical protein NTZ59_15675, partial [Bacteroidetes bacterium]|nr:hypothetical protein [Bacteroidota bacterium]